MLYLSPVRAVRADFSLLGTSVQSTSYLIWKYLIKLQPYYLKLLFGVQIRAIRCPIFCKTSYSFQNTILFMPAFWTTFLSCVFYSSELSLISVNTKVQKGYKMSFVDNFGTVQMSLVVACISDESDESSSSTMGWQLLSGRTDYWWPSVLGRT